MKKAFKRWKTYTVKVEDADYKTLSTPDKPIDLEYVKMTGKVSSNFTIKGEKMALTFYKFEPGSTFDDTLEDGHEEEILYCLQGRIEYDDGRVLTKGMATINLEGQPHKGKTTSDEPTILLAVVMNPMMDKFSKNFKVIAKRD